MWSKAVVGLLLWLLRGPETLYALWASIIGKDGIIIFHQASDRSEVYDTLCHQASERSVVYDTLYL
jgi:hypothetical protein